MRGAVGIVLHPALLFGAAGTVAWPQGWLLLILLYLFMTLVTRMLKRDDPGLFLERTAGMFREGQKEWDKVWLPLFKASVLSWLVVAGLDAKRFEWSQVPATLQLAGGAAFAVSLVMMYRVFRANTFLSPVVRVQRERNQTVVDSGPYGVVRHPMYGATVLLLAGASLLLGSWWALGLSVVLAAMMGVRAYLEEAALREELEGYADYAERVRYRMIPLLW